MTADIELLPLPRTLQHADDADLATHVQDYARANVAHATAAKDAEIEALRAEVAEWKASYQQAADAGLAHAERAERLAEALREAYGQVRELCDAHIHQYPEASFARYEAALSDHGQEVGK